MRPPLQNATFPPPRVFRYSLDWRFLLPIADPQKLRVLIEQDEEFHQALEAVGIYTSQAISFFELQQNKIDGTQSFVMPFGLSKRWVGAGQNDQVELYRSLRRMMVSGGYLLIGFHGSWNVRTRSHPGYHRSTPHRMASQLRRAGFHSVKLYGALPNLAIPEYIFDLDSRTIHFAMQNRFRRKPAVLRILRGVAETVGLTGMVNLLPAYFALAAP